MLEKSLRGIFEIDVPKPNGILKKHLRRRLKLVVGVLVVFKKAVNEDIFTLMSKWCRGHKNYVMQQTFKTSYFKLKFLNYVNKTIETLIYHWRHSYLCYGSNLFGAIRWAERSLETKVKDLFASVGANILRFSNLYALLRMFWEFFPQSLTSLFHFFSKFLFELNWNYCNAVTIN